MSESGSDQGVSSCRHVIIADDHVQFTGSLRRWLQIEAPRWTLDAIPEPGAALDAILENRHDIVLLDWRFPHGLSGLDICRRLRGAGCTFPIVMLTMMDGIEERLQALDAGADDHIVKDTITHRELCRRVEVTFHRVKGRPTPIPTGRDPVVMAGPIIVHLGAQAVFVDGELLHLPKHQAGCWWRLQGHSGNQCRTRRCARRAALLRGLGSRICTTRSCASDTGLDLGRARCARCGWSGTAWVSAVVAGGGTSHKLRKEDA